MSWKFNPPPGWPAQPEGWQPPPGWTPDPSWPPAPPGWQFWVADDTPWAGGAPPAAGPPDQTIHDQPTSFANLAGPGSPAGQPSGPPAGPSSPAAPAAGSATVPPFSQPAAGSAAPPPFGQPSFGSAPPPQFGQPSAGSAPPPQFGQPPTPPAGPSYPPPQFAAGGPAAPYVPIQQPADRPWHQRWWAIAGIALTVALVGCLGGTAIALVTDSDNTASPPTPTDPPTPQPSGSPTPGTSGGLAVGEERTGDAPSIVTLNLPPDGAHMVTLTFTGEGFFQASLVDIDGELIEYLGSANSDYTGTHLIDVGLLSDQTVAGIDISSTEGGSWSLLLQTVEDAPVWPDETEGSSNTVMQINPDEVSGETDVTGTHDGESNFIVWAYGPEDTGHSLLFNDIGQVPNQQEDVDDQSEQPITPDAIVLEIQADGNWTLVPN